MNVEKSDLDRIPLVPGGLPLIGHGLALMRNPLGLLSALPEYGPMCRIRLAADTVVFVSDADLTSQVLADDKVYDKGGPFYARAREIAGDGLGSCPHDMHRRQRRLCQPAFGSGRLPSYVSSMTRSIETTAQGWHDGQVIDLGVELSGMTFRIATETMFSTSLSDQQIREFATDLSAIAHGLFRRAALPPIINRLPTPDNRRYDATNRRVRQLAASVIAERRADRKDRGDLLSALLQASDVQDGAQFTDSELIDQVFTFFLGGAETTAGCLTWALYLLDRNRDVQDSLHEEIDSVLGGRPATREDLPSLPLTNRIITETLRLYPPTWVVTRQVTADTKLGDILLPAGTAIAVSPYVIHRSDKLYEDPSAFRPDRWVDTTPHHNRKTFIPFGLGARRCIGEQFALIETALALATITGRWRLASSTQRPISMSMTQVPVPDGVQMRVSTRQVVLVD
ncbi:cytochrome P450 [Nocardia vinacea]|uniref:cytochrome P450 n=1 Tax=Nocardia vinacea TaxID=96468 RepID=UPI002E0E6EE3|nr:cytochrome P450 [Nocardia vinacea]